MQFWSSDKRCVLWWWSSQYAINEHTHTHINTHQSTHYHSVHTQTLQKAEHLGTCWKFHQMQFQSSDKRCVLWWWWLSSQYTLNKHTHTDTHTCTHTHTPIQAYLVNWGPSLTPAQGGPIFKSIRPTRSLWVSTSKCVVLEMCYHLCYWKLWLWKTLCNHSEAKLKL